jgi:hypothetical protein
MSKNLADCFISPGYNKPIPAIALACAWRERAELSIAVA